ncbi:MAG: flagellar M-ring protein FliF C-terminal domain-containing protein [bacterium]
MTVRPGSTRPTRPTASNTRLTQAGAPAAAGPNQLLETFKNLNNTQKAIIAVVIILIIAIGITIFLYSKSNEYIPLYPGGKLDKAQLASVKNYLENNGIKEYRIDDALGQVYIHPKYHNKVYTEVIKQGFIKPNVAPELKAPPPGTTKESWENYIKQSTEYALSSKIKEFYPDKVSNVNVSLAIPKNDPLSENKEPVKASIILNTFPGKSLSNEEANAIIQTVANSVEGLDANNISLVVNGRILNPNAVNPVEDTFGIKQKVENMYASKLAQSLDQILGVGNYTVTVDVELDWDKIKIYREQYGLPDDPNSKVLSKQETKKTKQYEGGALDKNKENASEIQQQTIVNQKVDQVVTEVVKNPGSSIKRISVAVALNNVSDSTKAQVQQYIKNAIGLKEERGDSIAVVNLPFFAGNNNVISNPVTVAPPVVPVKNNTLPIQSVAIFLASVAAIGALGIIGIFLFKQNKLNYDRMAINIAPNYSQKEEVTSNTVVDLTTDKLGNKSENVSENAEFKTLVSEIENVAKSNPNEIAEILKKTWIEENK